ncbi:hypothetical protein MMC07_007283 [Pseudocyphellaria aurata]|nr:hypothetical protein [Pseudocyphellaria aurata]
MISTIKTFIGSFLLAVCLSEAIAIKNSFRHGHSSVKRRNNGLVASKRDQSAAFHDAGTYSLKLAAEGRVGGGADGSLILAKEYNRPGGPRVPTFVGRKDSSKPSPDGLLPGLDSPDILVVLFKDKGFNETDLAALVGALTVSKQFYEDPSQTGASQDNSAGLGDVEFYAEQFVSTPGTYRLKSLQNLSVFPSVS